MPPRRAVHAPPAVGSRVEHGYFPQNYTRSVVVAVIVDEPYEGEWIAVVRTWWRHKRQHHYDVVEAISYPTYWRPSPRRPSWEELRAMAEGGIADRVGP